MVSGNILEISTPDDVNNIRECLLSKERYLCNRIAPIWCRPGKAGEYCCTIDGCLTHINMSKVEYIEEKIIEHHDKSSEDSFFDLHEAAGSKWWESIDSNKGKE
jgi:hypothetical protein